MKSYRVLTSSAAALFAATCLAASPVAAAVPTPTLESNAYDLSVNLAVLTVINASLGPINLQSGSAPAAYNNSVTVVGIDQLINLGLAGEQITTGALTSTAQSSYPNYQGASASASIDGLLAQLGILSAVLGNTLSISADAVSSHSVANATGGIANAQGSSDFLNLNLSGSILGAAIGRVVTINAAALADVSPDANTTLLSISSFGNTVLKIILNEQVETKFPAVGSTPSGASISTNAIHVIFTDLSVLGIGVLRGDIIVAHSYARISDAMDVVPEPATWMQMIAGFGTIGLITRRRRRTVNSVA